MVGYVKILSIQKDPQEDSQPAPPHPASREAIEPMPTSHRLIALLLSLFSIRDVFVFGGILMLGYGLYQFAPWVAYAVCGTIISLLGLGWLDRK